MTSWNDQTASPGLFVSDAKCCAVADMIASTDSEGSQDLDT